MLRGWQAGVGGIGRALGVAPELEPAVRRDGDRAVARALDRHAERQGGVHGRVVAAERLETRDVRGVDVVRAVGQPGAERHGGPATAGQGGAEEDEEPDRVHGAAPRAAKHRSGPNRVTGHLRELAGQHHAQLFFHLVAQAHITFGFGRLALERVHLPGHFVKDVIDARQIQARLLQAGFSEALLGFEFRDAGCLFDDGPAVMRLAAQDLPNPPLLDNGIGFRPQTGAHKDVLNVT